MTSLETLRHNIALLNPSSLDGILRDGFPTQFIQRGANSGSFGYHASQRGAVPKIPSARLSRKVPEIGMRRSVASKSEQDLTDSFSQPEAWKETHVLLSSPNTVAEAKLFAATTLKGKVRNPSGSVQQPVPQL